MPTQSRDQAIVAILAEKIGDLRGRTDYDDEGNLVILNLSGLNLSHLLAELGQLTNLQLLNLSDNQWHDGTFGVNVGGVGERWTEIFNSQAPQYGGWADSGNYLADLRVGADGQVHIRLPRWTVLMFQRT